MSGEKSLIPATSISLVSPDSVDESMIQDDFLLNPFAMIAKQMQDAKTPGYFLPEIRRHALGSISKENLQNVAELLEADSWRRVRNMVWRYKGKVRMPHDIIRDYQQIAEDVDSLKESHKDLPFMARSRKSNGYFWWNHDIDLLKTASDLLEERGGILGDNISYIDEFACNIGIEGDCSSYDSEKARACFGCDYNIFHGENYPKEGPFSDKEGQVLSMARCIQEAREWGYGKFESKRRKNHVSDYYGTWLSENGKKKVVLTKRSMIRSNICDDYGARVHEVDDESPEICFEGFKKRYSHHPDLVEKARVDEFSHSYAGDYDEKAATKYREFHIANDCTGPIV